MNEILSTVLLFVVMVVAILGLSSLLAWGITRWEQRRRPPLDSAPDVWDGSDRESDGPGRAA